MSEFQVYAETPPKKGRGNKAKYEPRLEAIKKMDPGWYVIGEFNKANTATATKYFLVKRFTEFEFEARNIEGRGKLYARYKGLSR